MDLEERIKKIEDLETQIQFQRNLTAQRERDATQKELLIHHRIATLEKRVEKLKLTLTMRDQWVERIEERVDELEEIEIKERLEKLEEIVFYKTVQKQKKNKQFVEEEDMLKI